MSYDIAKLRELEAEAPSAPWSIEDDWTFEIHDAKGRLIGKFIGPGVGLLVALRNAAPELLDDLERISGLYEKAKAIVNEQSDELDRLRKLEASDLAFYALIERQDAGEEITPDEWVAAMKAQRACQVEAHGQVEAVAAIRGTMAVPVLPVDEVDEALVDDMVARARAAAKETDRG